MRDKVELIASIKGGISSSEGYIVVRGRKVFLRLLGNGTKYELMTSTAGEDRGPFVACADQQRLLRAAMLTAQKLNSEPVQTTDRFGRKYVKICGFSMIDRSDQTVSQVVGFLEDVCETFFEEYDNAPDQRDDWESDLQDIYQVLAVDDSGGDVYLSDGSWMGSDGSVYDRGR